MRGPDACDLQTILERGKMNARDHLVRNDGTRRPRCELSNPLARFLDQIGPDDDLVSPFAKLHFDRLDHRQRRTGVNLLANSKVSGQFHHGFVHNFLMRYIARLDGDRRLGIDRIPLIHQTPQCPFRIRILQQRPVRALPHPAHQHIKIRLEPDADPRFPDPRPRLCIDKRAAASREHHRPLVKQSRDHTLLALPEFRLAALRENLGDCHSRGGFNLAIRIRKRQAEPLRQPLSNRTFARTHHADQHNGPCAQRLPDQSRRITRLLIRHRTLAHEKTLEQPC